MQTSETTDSTTAALTELLNTGRSFSDPSLTKYVCHTSTIPLATTVDEQFLLRNDPNTVEVTHSIMYQPGYDEALDYRCCKKHCMYVNKRKHTSEPEFLRSNCPCGRVMIPDYTESGDEVEKFLQPLCFIQVLKELRYSFGYVDESVCESDSECCHNDTPGPKSNRPTINLAHVMFCQNSQAITDSRYSSPMRLEVGVNGWEAVQTPQALAAVLNTLYWFRKRVNVLTRKRMERAATLNFRSFKRTLEQVLHTVNGMITKKMLLFPCEMESYRDLSRYTAELFEAVLWDYIRPLDFSEVATTDNSIFVRMKTAMKEVKRSFCSENKDVRHNTLEIILGNPTQYCKFSKFFSSAVERLRRRIRNLEYDYTTSPMWHATMSGFSQTRNLGYLPPWIAEIKRKEFRANIGREKVIVPAEDLHLIRKVVQERQKEMGIEIHFLSVDGRDYQRDFNEVINAIKIPLKPSASIRSTVYQGGKVEDARQLLNDAMMNEWKIPVRNLSTGKITEYLSLNEQTRKDKPEHEGYLFWISLQIVLNWFGSKYRIYKDFVYELPGSEPWIDELWKMSIVHISEPGKERNLTKTSSVLAWLLTVASKVSQMVLAYNQDHRAGLILSAQDWMHQRRVSSGSFESEWMYDKLTRKRLPGVWNGFQDWKESTDFIPRQVGAVALAAWFQYIDMPRFFSDLVLMITQRDYTVTEVMHTNWEQGIAEKNLYKGKVTEGYMMSMPLTKTILHLMHDINIGVVHGILSSLGIPVSPPLEEVKVDPIRDQHGQFRVRPQDV
jgi:hypothetical protein